MKHFITKKSTPITSIALLVVFICSLFVFQVSPTKAEDPQAEMVWVLTETQVNPYDGQLEFYGGGKTPGWFGEARFEGTFLKYAVTETNFRIDDRWVDHEYEHHNVTIETFFEKPPLKMTPGETIELIAGFAHGGTAEDGGTRVQFWYDSEDVDIQPETVFAYAPWADNFDGTTEATYSFKVPPASSEGEIEIYAGWWNAEPCLVIWKYQAREVGGTDEEVAVPTQQQEEPTVELDPVQNEESSNITLAGHAIAVMGDVVLTRNDQQQKLEKGDQIWLGSCIKTGPQGRVRIRMNDVTIDGLWVDQNVPGNTERIKEVYRDQGDINPAVSRVRGPSYINIGTNSEACIPTLATSTRGPTRFSGLLGLLEGNLRVLLRRDAINSSFDVRAGVAICGIRGSEVFISYIPSDDLVYTQVLEGHMDVTSEASGETVSLTDNQSLVVSNGEIVYTGPITDEQWDANLEEAGLGDEDFPGAQDEWLFDQEELDPTYDPESFLPQQEASLPIAGYLFILCFVMVCGAAIIAIVVTIVYLVRRQPG